MRPNIMLAAMSAMPPRRQHRRSAQKNNGDLKS